MRIRLFTSVIALAFSHLAYAQSASTGKNIFPEGSFDVFGESKLLPSGWTFPDPNDKPWKAGFRAEVVKGASGSKELKIVRPEPPGSTIVGAKFPLASKFDRLRISYRLLAKELAAGDPDPAGNGVGIYVRFYDRDTKAIRSNGGWVGGQPVSLSDSQWQDCEAVFTVPETAATLELQVIFRSAKGEIRLDDVEVIPVVKTK